MHDLPMITTVVCLLVPVVIYLDLYREEKKSQKLEKKA